MKDKYLNKNTTDAIKGIALICMFIHHFFTFPSWYIDGISYPQLDTFAKYVNWPTKICVPVFAFLTGYFYFFTQKKTLHYSVKKMTDLLISYWAVYLPFLGFAIASGCYKFDLHDFIYELFGLKGSIMTFGWYVYFYCVSMILLPFLTKLSEHAPVKETIVLLVFPVAGCIIFKNFIPNTVLRDAIVNIQIWYPCVAVGYLYAKYKVFDSFDQFFETSGSNIIKIISYILLIGAAAVGRYVSIFFTIGTIEVRGPYHELIFPMDLLYAPMFIYGFAKLLQYIKNDIPFKLLGYLGRQSLFMWFLHCFFFNVCKEKTMKLLYFPRIPVLVLFFGLLLCYGPSALLSCVLRPVFKQKNRLLDNLQTHRPVQK